MSSQPARILLTLVCASLCSPPTSANNGTCATPLLGASTSGLLDAVAVMQNALGYAGLDSIDARKALEKPGEACTIKIASMINKKGVTVKPSSDGAQAAVRSNAQAFLESSCPGFGLCAEIFDGRDADVWPISTLTYMIVPTNTTDEEEGCDKMKTLYDYVKWILQDQTASDIAKELSMATMPVVIAQQAQLILDQMRCYDSTHGWQLVKDRKSRSDTLGGSGSSLQEGLQERLTTAYFQQSFVTISYTPSSSGTGRAALRAREFDFAGSDSVLDMTDDEFIRRGMRMVPAFAAAVGVVYNVDNVDELVLSRDAMQKMFTGEVFSWRDPAILATNRDVEALLPDEAILRVVRESKSGTTSALTKSLYAFAEHPIDAASRDYSLHVLGGSSFPDWPTHPQPYPGATTCKFKNCIRVVCEPGHFLDALAVRCVECPMGTFASEPGQRASCTACPAGSYTNTIGNSKCVKCDDQKYQDEEGQQECKACPANARRFSVEVVQEGGGVSKEQSPGVSVEECKCVSGFWLPESVHNASLGGLPCRNCPDGATCLGFPFNIPQSKNGFWGNPQHPYTFFECEQDSCLKEFRCVDGHTGRLCAQPADGYFTIGEIWFFKCPVEGYREIFTLFCVLCVIVVWMLLHHFSLKYDAFAIAFLFFQTIGLISKFRLRWHPNLNFVLITLRIINFDVDFFGPQCMLPGWNPATAYFVQLLLPFIVLACYAVYFYLMRHLKRRRGVEVRETTIENKGYLRSTNFDSDDLSIYLRVKGLSYFIMMFHTVAFRAFSVFVCQADSDGEHAYMVSSPTLECWQGAHIAMVVFSALYIPTLVCGVPLCLLWKMVRVQREDQLCDFTVTVSYWFAFEKFKVAFPFWELVLLARRFVLVLILVFVRVSMLQAALAIAFLNAFLYLHLTNRPFKDLRVGLLESFGLCCAMAYAVCGMLFFPSLDYTLECVGSANLAELGHQCDRNSHLKQETSIVLMLLLFSTLIAAVYISFKDIQAKVYSAAAAKKIEADKKWYGKDKLFKAIRSMPKDNRTAERIASICSSLGIDPAIPAAEQSQLLAAASETSGHGRHIAGTRKTVDAILGLREQASRRELNEVAAHEFADPEKLNLSDMLVGDCLQNWHKSLATLSEKELAVRLLFADQSQSQSQSMQQELAYMDLEMWIPAFAVRHELVNGFYSCNKLAQVLRELIEELPELMGWLATAEHSTVGSFANFVNSYTIFAKSPRSASGLHNLIVPGHKGQVVHWLMQCSEADQRAFLTIFGAMNSRADLNSSFRARLARATSTSPASPAVSRSNRVADSGDVDLSMSGKQQALPMQACAARSPSAAQSSADALPPSSSLPHAPTDNDANATGRAGPPSCESTSIVVVGPEVA